jgi:hypothetical protein
MYSIILDVMLITVGICITILTLGATIMMVKDFKDDMR